MTVATTEHPVTHKPRVLVVDDESGPREALRICLCPFFEVRSAGTAHEAMALLRDVPVDLVTLDQKLPDGSGLELLERIKREHVGIEVIIVTGYGSVKSAAHGIEQGAAAYLLKPFNPVEVVALVQQTLRKKQRLQYVREALQAWSGLQGSEAEMRQSWSDLKAGYQALGGGSTVEAGSAGQGAEAVLLLSDVMEAVDPRLQKHCSRVALYATLLGNQLALTADEQQALAFGALVHDIGKITDVGGGAMTTSTDPDGSTRADHTQIGARIVAAQGFSPLVQSLVACHHEQWDGRGGPQGLRGEEIPLLARVVTVAQAFERLVVGSPEQAPLSVREALAQLARMAGTQCDPALIERFLPVARP